MYSNYLYDDRNSFSDLYVDVSEKHEDSALPAVEKETKSGSGLKSLLSNFGFGDINLITLLILAFLLFDADEDERLIILALAFLMGI